MIITLTTDFGQSDGYVGAMKGVILSIAPETRLVDISHEIAPGDVRQAAYVLGSAAPFFPAGTIHLVVVDPGVGSARRAIAARVPQATFVAPDNGVLSVCLAEPLAAGQVKCRQLSNPHYHLPHVSATFHGRDVFAPVAARLASGAFFNDLGPLVTDPVILPILAVTPTPDGAWRGEVMHIDRFGNVITNLKLRAANVNEDLSLAFGPQSLIPDPQQLTIEIAGRRIVGLTRTYADRAPGELVALMGSLGYLEIAVRDGHAARVLDVHPGDAVTLRLS